MRVVDVIVHPTLTLPGTMCRCGVASDRPSSARDSASNTVRLDTPGGIGGVHDACILCAVATLVATLRYVKNAAWHSLQVPL